MVGKRLSMRGQLGTTAFFVYIAYYAYIIFYIIPFETGNIKKKKWTIRIGKWTIRIGIVHFFLQYIVYFLQNRLWTRYKKKNIIFYENRLRFYQ